VRLVLKLLAVAVILALAMLAVFALWGGRLEELFSQEACARWFQDARPYAWAVAILLLAGDLVLPVPATGIMAALGSVYGPWLGGFIGAAGAAASGLIGYTLARLGGRPLARRLASDQERARFQALFDRWGGLAVIISRAMPILPEVVSLLAGLARMRPGRFAAALVLGCLPTAFFFAWLGHASREQPWWGLVLAVGIPALIWPVFLHLAGAERAKGPP